MAVRGQCRWSWSGWHGEDSGGNRIGYLLSIGRVKSETDLRTTAFYAAIGPICIGVGWDKPIIKMMICALMFGVCCYGLALVKNNHWLDIVGMVVWAYNMARVVRNDEMLEEHRQ